MLTKYLKNVIIVFSTYFFILFPFNFSAIASNLRKLEEALLPRKGKKLTPAWTFFVSVLLILLGVGAGSANGFSVDVSPNPPLVEPVVVAPCDPTEVQYEVKVFGDPYTLYSLSFHEAPLNSSFDPQMVYGNETSMLTVYLPLVVSRPYYKDYTLHIRATSPSNSMASDDTRLIIANFTIEGSPVIKPVRALTHDTMDVTVSPYPPGYPAIPGKTEFFYDIKDQVFQGNIFHDVYFSPHSLSQTNGTSIFHFKAPYIVGRYRVKFYAQYGSHYSNWVESPWYFIDVSGVPKVSTGATSGCGPTGVNLLGTVNPMYSTNTNTWFEWGETALYGNATNAQALPSYHRTDVAINHRVDGLKPETEYHYRIVARNEWGTAFGNDRVFNTSSQVNSPPNIPHSPSPVNGAIFQDSNLDLNWEGGDPDPGDVVTYDVYFGKTSPPPVVSEAQLETSYDPGVLEDKTTYYWKIVATDSSSNISEGPDWSFTIDSGLPPQTISVSPESHNFGIVEIGSTSKETFTVTNTGNGDLEVGCLAITGADASEFEIQSDNCSEQTIAPSGNCTVEVLFSPVSEGAKTANLAIPSNDPDDPILNVPLYGEAGVPAPEINVKQAETNISVGDTYDFGIVETGSCKTMTFTIENIGNAPLDLNGSPKVQISGEHAEDFSVTQQPSSPIKPNESVTFEITFYHSAANVRTAQITIQNDDSDEDPYEFTITGNDLPIAPFALAGPVPDTGQTQSYTETFGEDSYYKINPPSYTKLDANGNDLSDDATSWVMVRDNVTGLIWEVKTDDGSIHDKDNRYTWYDSSPETNGGDPGTPGDGTDTEDFIDALNSESFGGFSDWRLPTIEELSSIVNSGTYNPAVNTDYFPLHIVEGWPAYYWSSTTVVYDIGLAWILDFAYYGGRIFNGCKSGWSHARAVRGGQLGSFGHLVINNDGTVTDTSTGLMWQQETAAQMTWEEALSYCENLSLASYTDWRLPNRNELRSLKDFSKYLPAVDTIAFPDTPSAQYWSSTTDVSNTNNAWTVNFGNGWLDANKSWQLWVRAVRGGQNQSLDHLVIWEPRQASSWNVGSLTPIKWNTQDITGNVKISISRQGGKDGTFEPIVESTENDGRFDWKVIGPVSVNCMLKIELTDDPSKGTTQGLFTIIDQPLMLLLLLEDDGGTTSDSSRNGNDGIVNGAAFLAGDGILNSNAYRFSWSNEDNIQVPYQESQTATNALTLEAWIYPTAWNNICFGYNRIVSKQPVYLLRGKNNGRAQFQILTENHGYQGVIDSSVMATNQWHYVVGTFDGRRLKLYVDGVLEDAVELPEEDSMSTNEADIYVGEYPRLNEGFTGTIDNVAIYKRARLQSEIEKTYVSIMLRCKGDFDGDKDVDGSDLAVFATGGGGDITLEEFAANFGRTDCPD